MANSNPFPQLVECEITFPDSPLLKKALGYTKEHTSPTTVNHCLRSAAYALLCIRKLPPLANVEIDKELVVFSCLFHDLGWATTESLISQDRRFEVDGAYTARSWIREHINELNWTERQIQLAWDAIALHTTPSIAQHKEPEVAAVHFGITADFLGHNFPGRVITPEEQKEIVRAFPRLQFHDNVVQIMCGLCKNKPDTTYDNFVGEFGEKYGLDGKGSQKEEFKAVRGQNLTTNRLMGALKAAEDFEGQ